MSTINQETVAKIARLARIRVEESEKQTLVGELNGIMGWIEQLAQVNTDGVEPMTGASNMQSKLRPDAVTDGDKQADILKNAPESREGYFVVPKVVE